MFLPGEFHWQSNLTGGMNECIYPLQKSIKKLSKEQMGCKQTFQMKRNMSVSSVTQSCLTLCDLVDCSVPGFPVHHQHLELTQTHVHWVGDAISSSVIPFPSTFNHSQHQVFSSESVLRFMWPKYLSFSISPFHEYSGQISFRIDWFELLRNM